jgi:type I restriction enzyme S subunit
MWRYEQYAPSGFDWLGDLPSHWSILRAKYVFREIDDRSVAGDEELLSVSHLTGVTPRSEKNVTMFMAEDYTGAKLCKDGDLVINTMWAWMGALGVSSTTGIVSPAYGVYRQLEQRLRPRYMDWLFRTPMYVAEYTRRSTGVNSSRLRLYPDRFLDMPVVIPPLEEQDRIVTFLDQKTSEIDAAIAQKGQLIELLEESKRCLVYDAVTRGLDGAVPLKKSGLSWLSNVPEHWDLKRLKSVASFITSGPRGWSDRLSDDGAVFLQSGNLNDSLGIELASAHRVVVPRGAEAKRTRLQDGDVLVCITGANTGRVAVAGLDGQEAYINQHLSLIRLADANPRFVAYSLAAQGGSYFYLCQYGLKEGLSLFDVANAPIIIPPLDEQNEIVAFLDQSVAKVDAALAAAASQCGQLEELKKAVIASAVTGRSVRR